VPAECGARLLATGPFAEEDLGVSCYHSKTGAVELYLNHLVDGPDEYVVADLTAGADSFASGLFTRFDLTVLVCEPTRKGVSVWRQWREYASGYDVAVTVIGNKVTDDADVSFLRSEVGDALAAVLPFEPAVRALEQGRPLGQENSGTLAALSSRTLLALAEIRAALDARYAGRDWERYTRQAAEFHVRNAKSWANADAGADLTEQIDPDFVLGPDAAAAAQAPTGQ
jgi:CO dehydrogenase maturation factor